MTDKELLEYAAKAAGIKFLKGDYLHGLDTHSGYWNPITDDGDALRLAVKLGISIQFSGRRFSVSTRPVFDICCEFGSSDRASDIRHAIVVAAAEIGKAM